MVLVIPADDYLDVRDPAWALLERLGAIKAIGGQVYFNSIRSEILDALVKRFPDRYPPAPYGHRPTPPPRARGPKIGRAVGPQPQPERTP